MTHPSLASLLSGLFLRVLETGADWPNDLCALHFLVVASPRLSGTKTKVSRNLVTVLETSRCEPSSGRRLTQLPCMKERRDLREARVMGQCEKDKQPC